MEIYKNIKHYENYQVSNKGNIKNQKTGHLLKPSKDRGGYFYVILYGNKIKKHKYIHRLVADAFLENPNSKGFVDHIDNNRTNNNIENLRFATRSENGMNRLKQKNDLKLP